MMKNSQIVRGMGQRPKDTTGYPVVKKNTEKKYKPPCGGGNVIINEWLFIGWRKVAALSRFNATETLRSPPPILDPVLKNS